MISRKAAIIAIVLILAWVIVAAVCTHPFELHSIGRTVAFKRGHVVDKLMSSGGQLIPVKFW